MIRPRRDHLPCSTSRRLRRTRRLRAAGHDLRQASGTCHPRNRSGAALIFVLILLLFLSMLGITLARLAIAQHRQRLQEEIHAQTVRLAEAGWNRAASQLARNPDYAGELWQPVAAAWGPDRTAAVKIEVLPSNTEPSRQVLHVDAEYPVGSPRVNRVSREGMLALKK